MTARTDFRPIDNVNTNNLSMALKMVDINIDIATIDRLIDIFEVLEQKGNDFTIDDMVKLKWEWESLNK